MKNKLQCVNVIKTTEKDARDVWNWRNDDFARSMSMREDSITWEEHIEWFLSMLKNKNIYAWIGLDSCNNKLGICRFDLVKQYVSVSLNLNPDFRGKRLSSSFLDGSINKMAELIGKNLRFSACIKRQNIASIKCFERSGFVEVGNNLDYLFYEYAISARAYSDLESKLKIIDEIEKIRTNNNVNWMDLLRLAYKSAPEDTKSLIRKINADDNSISALFAQLGE